MAIKGARAPDTIGRRGLLRGGLATGALAGAGLRPRRARAESPVALTLAGGGAQAVWDEFIRIARQLKEKGNAPYGFAMGWQNSSAYRWLPFLYQHGGQMLDAELRQPQLVSPTGVETLAWTQSWFKEGLVPPSTSVKSSEQTQNLFANGTMECCWAATGKSRSCGRT